MRRYLVASIAALLLAALWPAASGAAEPASRPPTPVLLDRAVSRGEVERARADLYLLYALQGDPRLPARFRSQAPWRGTLPLLELRRRVRAMDDGPTRNRLEQELGAVSSCGGEVGGPNSLDTTHFHIEYTAGTIAGGLTINDYGSSLETTWGTEVTSFGWAAPPLNAPRYLVVVSNLGSGLYGFVTSTGNAGNNPNTSWNEGDAQYSCMALNRDYTGFPSPPQASLDATVAHEFNHSLQFGYGALNGTVPDEVYIEGGATWVEDEVFDSSNDNYYFLWPNFADGMDTYNASPYPYWITWRGFTERYGTGTAGAGEQVMEDFWELVSKNTANNSAAMNTALQNKGTTTNDAYHAHAIAAKFLRACGGGYTYPHCFEEGPGYATVAGPTAVHKTIGGGGGSATGTLEVLALNWVQIPTDAGTYGLTLKNTGTGGSIRGSAVCDTGSGFEISAFPAVVGGGASTTIPSFDSDGCSSAVAVLTNHAAGGGRGGAAYQLSTSGGGGGTPSISIANAQVTEGQTGSKPMVFTVSLSEPAAGTVTVNYATQAISRGAKPGVDFQPESGTVTFASGDTSQPISITIFGDTVNERNERFRVVLSNPSGATIADGIALGTIIDND